MYKQKEKKKAGVDAKKSGILRRNLVVDVEVLMKKKKERRSLTLL